MSLFSEHAFMNHMEYPIINEAYRYKEHRYLYGTVLKSDFKVLGKTLNSDASEMKSLGILAEFWACSTTMHL